MSDTNSWRNWHIPFSRDQITLREAKESLSALGAKQEEIPLMIQLVENPRHAFALQVSGCESAVQTGIRPRQ